MLYNSYVRITCDIVISAVAAAVAWHLAGFWGVIGLLAFGLWNYWDGMTRRFVR